MLLVGATGLVGGEILRLLEHDPLVSRIVVLARRPLLEPPSKAEVHVVDFERLREYEPLFAVDQVFCALGTTIKAAGSRKAFRHVDYDYALQVSKLGASAGAHHLLLVSAMGADAHSRIFYNRVKGELEDAIRGLPYRGITIVRPSLLLGRRHELRLGEAVGQRLGFLFPPSYRPVQAHRVALALVEAAHADAHGMHIIQSAELRHVG